MKKFKIKDFWIGNDQPLTVISGPCVIESEEHALYSAEQLKEIFSHFPFHYIYKSSYDKANRSSIRSYRGPGLEEGLQILEKIKHELDLPIFTDVHTPKEAIAAADVVDMIQIPAFLSRQTDLIVAAASTQIPINVKKGQFLAPWDMKNVIEKIESQKNEQILLTDRGTSFGYNNLVSDMRTIPIMQELGYPVCFDASHSVQIPGGLKTHSGGETKFIPTLAKAAIAAGANVLYIESHPNPSRAKSDAASVMEFEALKKLLFDIQCLYEAVHPEVKLYRL